MKLALLVLVAACHSNAGDDYPIGPGGDGPSVGSHPGGGGAGDGGTGDGGAGDGDAGAPLQGRVCLLTDLRQIGNLARCATTGAGGLSVTLGTRSATTAGDGRFTIFAPLGAGFTWHVTGLNAITRSAMPFGTDNTIPAISETRYNDLVLLNGAEVTDLQGSIVVRVVSGAAAVPGITAATNDATGATLYDSPSSAENWAPNATDAAGIAWLPGVNVPVPARPVSVVLKQLTTTVATLSVAVEDQTITFVTQDLQ
jgi:hypothetical protein